MGEKKKKKQDEEKQERKKEEKKRKKEIKEQAERERKKKQMQAQVDALVDPIYKSGLADAYKCKHILKTDFLQELYKEGVRFNVYEFAAQKVLKYEKMQKEKAKKIQQLNLSD